MKLSLSWVMALTSVVFVLGFRNEFSFKIRAFRASITPITRMRADHAAYNEIKQQIKSTIASKFKTGVPDQFKSLMNTFLQEYGDSNLEANEDSNVFKKNLLIFFQAVKEATEAPFQFKPYHRAVRQPLDYYKWGNDFLRPLIVMEQSRLLGVENARRILELANKGENVVILSNHQTEADPQVISVLLEEAGLSALAERVIFVAGHKVTTDPVAIPFSMGRNLICIHSKKHIKNPPEQAASKQKQNLEAMNAMGALAAQGGNVFWVAPSGGRDRPDAVSGEFTVAPFDAKVLDMFQIIAMQSKKPMHYFPMAMYTHQLVPPPKSVSSSVGEERSGKRGPVSVHFLEETDGLGQLKDSAFAQSVQDRVTEAFQALTQWHASKQKEQAINK